MTISDLEERTANCGDCYLCNTRTELVFGEGDPDADLMIVGKAPGIDDDKSGQPFSGRNKSLLDAMLDKIGLSRSDVYVTHVVKCRPPRGRDPEQDELDACMEKLAAQIRSVQPKAVFAMGKFTSNLLTGNDGMPMNVLRGQDWPLAVDDTPDIPVVVAYHPSYVRGADNREEKVARLSRFLTALRQAVGIARGDATMRSPRELRNIGDSLARYASKVGDDESIV